MLITEKMDELARQYVGDGKRLNTYFVTDGGHVVTITDDFDVAYNHWNRLAHRRPMQECTLEDRRNWVLASVEPIDDGSDILQVFDDTHMLRKG